MIRFLDIISKIVPFLIFVWAIYSLLFRPAEIMWGLPSIWWYVMGIVTALLIVLIDFMAWKFPK
jgi:hypothetical protein